MGVLNTPNTTWVLNVSRLMRRDVVYDLDVVESVTISVGVLIQGFYETSCVGTALAVRDNLDGFVLGKNNLPALNHCVELCRALGAFLLPLVSLRVPMRRATSEVRVLVANSVGEVLGYVSWPTETILTVGRPIPAILFRGPVIEHIASVNPGQSPARPKWTWLISSALPQSKPSDEQY